MLLITEVTVGSTCTDALISTRSHRLCTMSMINVDEDRVKINQVNTNITCEIRSV